MTTLPHGWYIVSEGWLFPMLGRPHYPTRYARRSLPKWVQAHRIDAAKAKRARRRARNVWNAR